MVKTTFTDHDLADFARQHILYEIGAAANGAIAWYYSQPTLAEPVQSCLMSATLVHLRLLADFLSRSPRGDDVAAVHYLDSWSASEDPLGDEREAIDGHVAHLTMRREQRRLWNLVEVAAAVFWDLDRFLKEIERHSAIGESFDGARSLVDGFLAWARDDGMDLGLQGEGDGRYSEGDTWYRSLPVLPARVRGS